MPAYSTATRYRCAREIRAPPIPSISATDAPAPSAALSSFSAGEMPGWEDRWSLEGGDGSAREGSNGRLEAVAVAASAESELAALMATAA